MLRHLDEGVPLATEAVAWGWPRRTAAPAMSGCWP